MGCTYRERSREKVYPGKEEVLLGEEAAGAEKRKVVRELAEVSRED